MYGKTKESPISFRPSEGLTEKIEDLAGRIESHRWDFPWGSPLRKAGSKSGVINLVLTEKMSFDEIRSELKEAEEASETD